MAAFELLDGGIKVFVSADHRFGTDAFLLADFASPRPGETACDLGTGCGIIPLLWFRPPFPRPDEGEEELSPHARPAFWEKKLPAAVYGVEIQEEGAALLKKSALENSLTEKLFPIRADLSDTDRMKANLPFGRFDLVTCNPPYKPAGTGILSEGKSDKIARHETMCTLEQVCEAAASLLKFGGRFCMCLRPERLPEAMAACQAAGITPKRLRFVVQRPGKAPWLFLLEGKKGAKPFLQVLPDLMVEEGAGFSPEMLRIYHKAHALPRKENRETVIPLPQNGLWLVGTPIGSKDDLAPRAGQALREADFLIAEHLRAGKALCRKLGIDKELFDYNALRREGFEALLARLEAGERCALFSDAGMPCFADPGTELVNLCHDRGIPVHVFPGPSAAVSALAASGFPAARFSFEGFLSTAKTPREAHLRALAEKQGPFLFYEADKKLPATLRDLLRTLGDRPILLAKDLTKGEESIRRTTLAQAAEEFAGSYQKGEFVLVVGQREEEEEPACK